MSIFIPLCCTRFNLDSQYKIQTIACCRVGIERWDRRGDWQGKAELVGIFMKVNSVGFEILVRKSIYSTSCFCLFWLLLMECDDTVSPACSAELWSYFLTFCCVLDWLHHSLLSWFLCGINWFFLTSLAYLKLLHTWVMLHVPCLRNEKWRHCMYFFGKR